MRLASEFRPNHESRDTLPPHYRPRKTPLNTFAETLPWVTRDEAATRDLGEAIAARLRPGDVLALYGEVGSGKTHLVQGIARYFGISAEDVNSPTFIYVNEYHAGSALIYHFDAYRLSGVEEWHGLGLDEYLSHDAISLIEWADRVEEALPAHTVRIRAHHVQDGRLFTVEGR
jgi:tRNA threonylcarbamoyladenosine biosynthesis protein TsaE